MNIDDLNKIKQIDTPPYLFTRIQQKIISNKQDGSLSKPAVCALGLAFSAIVCINVYLITQYNNVTPNVKNYAQAMNLTTTNDLYK
jgi:hypothetical protein